MNPLETLLRRRIILVSGKGGVGRSTAAAGLAIAAAKLGRKTLLTEVGDWAHAEAKTGEEFSPLARIFGRNQLPLSPQLLDPSEAPTLFGAPAQARVGQELFLRTVIPSDTLVKAALSSDAIRKLAQFAPSLREMGVYYHLLTWLREDWETIVVDMPATGHALGLATLPDLLLKALPKGPISSVLREGLSHLNDPQKAAAWIVTLPERLPITEAMELAEGFERARVPVGGFLVNRIPRDPFTASERELLRELVIRERPFGAEGFLRAEEVSVSLERLRAGARGAVLTVPEWMGLAEGEVPWTMASLWLHGEVQNG